MKIFFLCGSAEPGKDGVGDYTRRMCGELIRRGHQAQILSLCDKHTDTFIKQIQVIENTEVVVSRIPIKFNFLKRLSYTQGIVQEFTPNWISLQFVPYSFNPKGLPLWLPSFLKKINGEHKWHMMFHELWVGMNKESSLKLKLWGQLQKKYIFKMIRFFSFDVIHTQSNYYQSQLENLGFSVDFLPLFSNIPVLLDKKTLSTTKRNKNDFIIVIFGSIYLGAPISSFAKELTDYGINHHLNIIISFIGRCGNEQENWANIFRTNSLEVRVMGEQSVESISELFSFSQLGIINTPLTLLDKSGSYAAMKDHRLRVICLSHNWTPIICFNSLKTTIDLQYKKGNLEALLNVPDDENARNSLFSITNSFLNNLSV